MKILEEGQRNLFHHEKPSIAFPQTYYGPLQYYVNTLLQIRFEM
jgi:hypothetical protein